MTSAMHPRLGSTPTTISNSRGRSGVRSSAGVLVLIAALVFSLTTCGGEVIPPDILILEVTSEAPLNGGTIQSLRFLFTDETGTQIPANITDEGFNLTLAADQNPVRAAVFISVDFGGTAFPAAEVTLQLTGRIGNQAVAIFEGPVVLTDKKVVKTSMMAIGDACDSDADGFIDCGMPGCCPEGGLQVSDCEPGDASANPWGTEDICEACSDTVDNDCVGGDVPCVDADGDGADDKDTCPNADCDPTNDAVYPGALELCDGIDNNCDQVVDDGIFWNGLALGATCGEGACAGGTVVCDTDDANGLLATCSSLGNALDQEICNGVDDNCDGRIDEGCGDIDGDGIAAEDDNGNILDCNDLDASIYPGADEPCCDNIIFTAGDPDGVCDKNCDGSVQPCAPEDTDGDGFVEPSDCGEGDPNTYPNAQEKCGDGIDQDCFGGDLPCDGLTDEDGDQWPATDALGQVVDCNDNNPDVNPGATEICNGIDDNCKGGVDEGNPAPTSANEPTEPTAFTSMGADCGSDIGECRVGTWACANNDIYEGEVICAAVILPATEWCDGLDNDCDASTDEDFLWEGGGIGADCIGLGFCGAGTVHCACPPGLATCSSAELLATCSSQPNGTDPQNLEEVCDAVDNDCDGELNENLTDYSLSTCLKEGVCGAALAGGVQAELPTAVCNQEISGTWSCDYSNVPSFENVACPAGAGTNCELTCDGLDNNCDSFPDGEFLVGSGCDGPDPDLCATGIIVCNTEMTGGICDESGGQQTPELCDDLDNDCDGLTDEDFRPPLGDFGLPCDSDDSDLCENGTFSCTPDGSGIVCLQESESQLNIADLCEGTDEDCDGLTDEDYPTKGDTCDSNDSDMCANGVRTCTPGGTGTECLAANESETNIVDICNGVDDDCDGLTDEDFPTLGDACDSLDSDACANSVLTCTPDGSDVECLESNETIANIEEICDGVDNDCQNGIDDIFDVGTVCDSADSDECPNGTKQCTADETTTFCSENVNFLEVCDNEFTDEDCDGSFDEDWKAGGIYSLSNAMYTPDNGSTLGEGCGTGDCSGGSVVCTANGVDLVCDSDSSSQSETCDDADQDCDGTTDEGWTGGGGSVSLTGALDSSDNGKFKGDSCGSGDCNGGTVVCTGNEQDLRCSTDNDDNTETCNGQDDDCDGTPDDGLTPPAASKQDGVCSGSVQVCNGGSGWGEPNYTQISDYETTETSPAHCDALDNDCDSVVDEACQCNYDGKTIGVCVNGTINNTDGACDPPSDWVNDEGPPGFDCLDALDNDCDGVINELCVCVYTGAQGNSGVCASGSTNDALGDCQAPVGYESGANEVTCDGSVDNNCDGTIDDGCPCDFNGINAGVCAGAGIIQNGGSCGGSAPADFVGTENLIVCDDDNLDNDCDGAIDEFCPCDYVIGGTQGVCVFTGPGTGGISNALAACTTAPTDYDSDPDESGGDCNDGLDNNCDGTEDDGCSCHYLTFEVGPCQNGGTIDTGGGCDIAPALYNVVDQCLGVDNNCNGVPDEGCDCNLDGDQSPDSDGVCKDGGTVNGSGVCTVKAGVVHEDPEVTCDSLDNDCDGLTDEDGCPCVFTNPNNGQTSGLCATATNSSAVCQDPGVAADDTTCDQVDEDCDGTEDEDYVGDPCDESGGDGCKTTIESGCSSGSPICPAETLDCTNDTCEAGSGAYTDVCQGCTDSNPCANSTGFTCLRGTCFKDCSSDGDCADQGAAFVCVGNTRCMVVCSNTLVCTGIWNGASFVCAGGATKHCQPPM